MLAESLGALPDGIPVLARVGTRPPEDREAVEGLADVVEAGLKGVHGLPPIRRLDVQAGLAARHTEHANADLPGPALVVVGCGSRTGLFLGEHSVAVQATKASIDDESPAAEGSRELVPVRPPRPSIQVIQGPGIPEVARAAHQETHGRHFRDRGRSEIIWVAVGFLPPRRLLADCSVVVGTCEVRSPGLPGGADPMQQPLDYPVRFRFEPLRRMNRRVREEVFRRRPVGTRRSSGRQVCAPDHGCLRYLVFFPATQPWLDSRPPRVLSKGRESPCIEHGADQFREQGRGRYCRGDIRARLHCRYRARRSVSPTVLVGGEASKRVEPCLMQAELLHVRGVGGP